MKIISVRENPNYKNIAIKYLQQSWESTWPILYQDCISNCVNAKNDLPQWYLLEKETTIIGCAGLITNDFISRMDLYPWLCAVFIDKKQRGNAYATILMDKAKFDAKKFGFETLYLSTEHVGYYEKYGFKYIGQGYHPWKEESRVYKIELR